MPVLTQRESMDLLENRACHQRPKVMQRWGTHPPPFLVLFRAHPPARDPNPLLPSCLRVWWLSCDVAQLCHSQWALHSLSRPCVQQTIIETQCRCFKAAFVQMRHTWNSMPMHKGALHPVCPHVTRWHEVSENAAQCQTQQKVFLETHHSPILWSVGLEKALRAAFLCH